MTFLDELDQAALREVLARTEGEAPVTTAGAARIRAARMRRRRGSVAAAAAVCAIAVTATVYAGVHQGGPGTATTPAAAGGATTGSSQVPGGCRSELPPVNDPAECVPPQGPLPGHAPLGQVFGTITVPDLKGHPDRTVPLYEGVANAQLNRGGGGHYPAGALPGGSGNFAVAGFRDTHGEAFRFLADLTAGDTVTVTAGGSVYTYTIDTTRQTLPGDTRVLEAIPHGSPYTTPGHYLTLTTTAPQFSTSARLVVWGHLTSTRAA